MPKNSYPNVVACDLDETNGEGRLALLQLEQWRKSIANDAHGNSADLTKFEKICPPRFPKSPRTVHSILTYSWLLCQILFLRLLGKGPAFVLNFLPLWNPIFFLIVSKSSKLGPITGGGQINVKHLDASMFSTLVFQLTRNVIIPFLYKISAQIIYYRSLHVKPATRSVSLALKYNVPTPRAIDADISVFEGLNINSLRHDREIDLVSYVGLHPFKNTNLTISVLNRLAEFGYVVHLIGPIPKSIKVHHGITHHTILPHKRVIETIGKSVAVLSLSLEEAGLFTLEAAANGCFILCLPNSGGAALPGAKLLISSAENLTEEVLVQRCIDAMRTFANCHSTDLIHRVLATREIHEDAKIFFYQSK